MVLEPKATHYFDAYGNYYRTVITYEVTHS